MTPAWLVPEWPAPPGVRAAATLRTGGVSPPPWHALNLGDHVGDDPARVAANRRLLGEALGLPEAPAWLSQVHGREVLRLEGATLPAERVADGAVTGRPGRVLAVLTADCLPVLFCSADGRRIGVAHAGWRGLADGVLEATFAALGAPARAGAGLDRARHRRRGLRGRRGGDGQADRKVSDGPVGCPESRTWAGSPVHRAGPPDGCPAGPGGWLGAPPA
jgi:hypothetical protein